MVYRTEFRKQMVGYGNGDAQNSNIILFNPS